MSIFSQFLKGGKNPANAAMPYLNQIPGMEQQNYNPYIQAGQNAYQNFSGPLGDMAKDPAAFLESLMGKYEPSKGYQLKRDEMLKAAGNTAAAGGMRGSLQDIDNESHLTDSLLGEDMQQWLANVLGIQNTGLQGEQNLYNTGFNATQNLTGDLANIYGTQGQLAFQGQRENNQRGSDLMSGLLKALGGLGGLSLPGGGTIGGKIGDKILGKFI